MSKFSVSSKVFCILLSAICASGCPQKIKNDLPVVETSIVGRAPLNLGGRLMFTEVYSGDVKYAEIDEDGRFDAQLRMFYGEVLVEAQGGHYIDQATGHTIRVNSETLNAILPHVEVAEESRVVIGPWTHLAAAAAHNDPAKYADILGKIVASLTCDSVHYRNLHLADPLSSRASSASNLDAEALAQLHLGGWSHLAADLSKKAGIPPGTRITTTTLLLAAAQDISDGVLDGTHHGVPINLLDGVQLPPNMIRGPFAQSVRSSVRQSKSDISLPAVDDLLRCSAIGINPVMGKPDALLDTKGPDLYIGRPEDGAVLRDDFPIQITAQDKGGVQKLSVFLEDNTGLRAEILDAPLADPQTLVVRQLDLPTKNFSDGPYTLVAKSVDAHGNQAELRRRFDINNSGGAAQLKVLAPDPGQVEGVVEVRCSCIDRYLESCQLLPLPGMQVISTAAEEIVANWDTRAVFDGTHSVICIDTSRRHRPVQSAKTVTVRNTGPGEAEGAVFFDTHVRDVVVNVYEFADGRRGRLLGTTQANDGTFAGLEIAADYDGPIFFEASESLEPGKKAQFNSAVLRDRKIYLSQRRITMVWDDYHPGDKLTHLSINAATSLAQSLGSAIWQHKPEWASRSHTLDSFTAASRLAHSLIEEHISPGQSFSSRQTDVADLTADKAAFSRSNPSTLLALFDVGLSRLAADYSVAHNASLPQALTGADLLRLLQDDASDCIFDGIGKNGKIQLLNQDLSKELLRRDLARAIHRWLKGSALGNDKSPADWVLSPILSSASDDFTRTKGLLPHMAEVVSPLFAYRPGMAFDTEGPQLSISLTDWHGNELKDGIPLAVGGMVKIRVTATDLNEVASIQAFVADEELAFHERQDDIAVFDIDTHRYPDGELPVRFRATDQLGNVTDHPGFAVNVQNTPPVAQLPPQDNWANGALQILAPLSKKSVSCRIEGAPEGSTCTIELTGARISLAPFATDGRHTLDVITSDAWGNDGHAQLVVLVDTAPPVIEMDSSAKFTQDGDGSSVSLTGQPLLQKRYDRFDYFGSAENISGNNLPVILFRVDDRGDRPVGSLNDEVRVYYRYRFETAHGQRVRDWEALESRKNLYQVVLSYQTLLPQDVLRLSHHEVVVNNFIARSTAEDQHHIDILAIDRAGNEMTKTLNFYLDMQVPPVELTCDFTKSIIGARLVPASIVNVFQKGFHVSNVNAKWGSPLDQASLAPTGTLHLNFTGMSAELNSSLIYRQYKRTSKRDKSDYPFSCGTYSLHFNDNGQCAGRNKPWNFPILSADNQENFGSQRLSVLDDTQSIMTDHITIGGFGVTSSPIVVSGENIGHDGNINNWTQALGLDGYLHIQFYHRTGRQAKHLGLFRDSWSEEFEERGLFRDFAWTRMPFGASISSSTLDMPNNPRIVMNPSCALKNTLHWNEYSPPLPGA
jgi:hypothetical protein